MFLYELAGPDPLVVSLVAIITQLTSDIDSGKQKADWTVDELLQYLKDMSGNELIIDKADLYNMIKKPPLNAKISNIKGDDVIFKGQETIQDPGPDENKKIVKQMAHKAIKK